MHIYTKKIINFFVSYFQRAELSDFDRFKLRRAKRIRNALRTNAFFRLKKLGKKEKVSKTSKAAKPVKKSAAKK